MNVPSRPTSAPYGIFLSWTKQNRRSSDLADALGLEAKFVCVGTQRPATAPLRWLAQGVLSLRCLMSRRTTSIVLMMPPYPALLLCRAVARIRDVPLVVDAHSSVFEDQRFARFLPSTLKHLRRCDLTVVTNAHHRELLESNGIVATELHNPPASAVPLDTVDPTAHVLVPASWHADEPIVELIDMARTRPDRTFVITGRPTPALTAAIAPVPTNVVLSGFVSDDEYASLLRSASAVCCLTTNDNTMQMGGYEALALGLPLITSDFELLRAYFGDAAHYTHPDAASIGDAIDRVFDDHAGNARRMAQRRTEIEHVYELGLQPIRVVLERRFGS